MPEPLAPLELTIEAPGHVAVDGSEVRTFDNEIFEERLKSLIAKNPDAFAIGLINPFANDEQQDPFRFPSMCLIMNTVRRMCSRQSENIFHLFQSLCR